MTAIIFGASGQDGFYLTELLRLSGVQVIGISRTGNYDFIDIISYDAVAMLIKKTQADFVFHFAANSTTRHDAIFENNATIGTGTINLLEAVKVYSPATKVFISGSGLQFKNEDLPIKESDDFCARDPYSVSRIHSVFAARYYRTLGVKTYVGYFFNHDSPRRTERHMAKKISAFAKRIAEGNNEKLVIGDISVVKEWTFAGDVVEGVWQLVNQDSVYEANIGSGKGYSIKEWVETCFGIIGKDWQHFVILKNDFIPEYKMLVSDSSLINALGWAPKIPFKELAQMMIDVK